MHDKKERPKAERKMHDEPIIILNDVTLKELGIHELLKRGERLKSYCYFLEPLY